MEIELCHSPIFPPIPPIHPLLSSYYYIHIQYICVLISICMYMYIYYKYTLLNLGWWWWLWWWWWCVYVCVFKVLKTDLRASYMLRKFSATELHPKPPKVQF